MCANESQDPQEKSTLIVAPLALLEQWKEEIGKIFFSFFYLQISPSESDSLLVFFFFFLLLSMHSRTTLLFCYFASTEEKTENG
jgi:SNF2 family DNA or RNA helicase